MECNDKIYMGFGRMKGMGMIFKFLTRVLSRCYQSKCKKNYFRGLKVPTRHVEMSK